MFDHCKKMCGHCVRGQKHFLWRSSETFSLLWATIMVTLYLEVYQIVINNAALVYTKLQCLCNGCQRGVGWTFSWIIASLFSDYWRSFCNHQIGSFTKWAVFYFLHSNFIHLCLFCTRNEKGHKDYINILSICAK